MDLQTIARLADLPLRKIRYILDQRMLPGVRGCLQKHFVGRPRSFTPREAYCIAVAALLLEGGAQRKTVVEVMARLAATPWPTPGCSHQRRTSLFKAANRPRSALEALAAACGKDAEVLVGDGAHLRVLLDGADTGWLGPCNLPHKDYCPSVVIHLHLATLRSAFDSATGD